MVIGGMLLVLIVVILLLGRFYPGSGADALDWKPTRSPEAEAHSEEEDLDQMLAATNARRARRGAEPLTEESLRRRVADDERALSARREALTADREVEQVLAAKNERRVARGHRPVTLDEFKQSRGLG